MSDPDTISADYTLRPSELAATLALLVEARQPVILWGAPGSAKSAVAQQVAADAGREYVDVRALLLDPVDLRGIPWRDSADRTRWAPPAFLPPTDDPGRWLINLEELPSAVPMVQAALYQLVLDRKVGEYELPEGASLIACGNRESDRGVVHRMPTPLASRFVHLEIRVDARDWCKFGIRYRITPVPDADHFMAKLASDDTDRVKRDIEHQVEERLHDAVGDLYRRLGEAVERVSERLQEDGEGKPLVFRDSMIENIRGLVDVVPRLNIFGDDRLARLCEQVKEKIASVEPASLRPSRAFDPAARARVKRDADALMEQFAGYFGSPAETAAEPASEPERQAA